MAEHVNIASFITQKIQEFKPTPDPEDWEVIYERLHPKRRFIWRWFLLAGVLILAGGGFYNLNQDNNSSGNSNSSTNNSQGSQTTPQTNTPDAAALKENNATTPADDAEATKINEKKLEADLGANKRNNAGNSIPAGGEKNTARKQASSPTGTAKKGKTSNGGATIAEATSISFEKFWSLALIDNNADRPTSGVQKLISTRSPLQIPEQKAIPTLNPHKNKGWFIGVYGGAGINDTRQPGNENKVTNPGNPGPNGFRQEISYINNGFHYEAGAVLQKQFKKFEFSIGAGIQLNNWKQGYNIFKDSIANGSVISSTEVAGKQTNYEHVAVEMPVMLGYRINGKGANSFWVNAGINNAFTVYLKELDFKTTGAYPWGQVNDPLTSPINKYYPQLRLGLTYNHAAAKYHWQVSPFFQYGLTNVVESGDPDIRMSLLGLQFRYYFLKIR